MRVDAPEKIYPTPLPVPHAEHAEALARLARCRDLLKQARDWLALLGREQGCEQLVQRIDAHLRRGS